MKNLTFSRVVDEPLPGTPTQRRKVTVEVELRGFVPSYEQLPATEEARYEPLLKGYLQLECEARAAGVWSDVMQQSKNGGLFAIDDPWDRLNKMDEVFKRLRRAG